MSRICHPYGALNLNERFDYRYVAPTELAGKGGIVRVPTGSVYAKAFRERGDKVRKRFHFVGSPAPAFADLAA